MNLFLSSTMDREVEADMLLFVMVIIITTIFILIGVGAAIIMMRIII